jgi:carboxylate/amino acid/amine transporter
MAMTMLWLVTLGWAFSFSLIGVYLSGQVDDDVSVLIRTGLALLLFLPFMLRARPTPSRGLALIAIGGLQIGVMYLLLFRSFGYLTVPEVLLFTIFTPLYVTLLDELLTGRLRLPLTWWLAASLAVVGAGVIRFGDLSASAWTGFALIQGANLCFAAGQVLYRRLPMARRIDELQEFGYFFLGGTIVAAISATLFADLQNLPSSPTHWLVLLWLGLGASGLGYLLWNSAARGVNTGQLAVMNNMLIPAGIVVNVLIWNRDADWLRLSIGASVLLAALWLAQHGRLAAIDPAR